MAKPLQSSVPPPSDAKIKAVSTELNYHHGPRDLIWRLRAVAVAAGLFAAGVGGSWVLMADRGKATASPGPLSASHESFHHDCDQCHEPFHPVHDHTAANLSNDLLGTTLSADKMDAKCKACHPTADAHHDNTLPPGIGHCASCHSEHRGHDFNLTATDDQTCVSCHGDLNAHTDTAIRPRFTTADADSIRTFLADLDGSHQEFPVVKDQKDPGRLKFTHGQHMLPGIPAIADPTSPIDPATAAHGKKMLAEIDPSLRERYRAQGQRPEDDATNLVSLECQNCHLPAGAQFSNSLTSADLAVARGSYMLPISYDSHCRACHPLNVPMQVPQSQLGPGVLSEITAVPHGVQPAGLKKAVRDAIAGWLTAEPPSEPSEPIHPALSNPPPLSLEQQIAEAERGAWSILLNDKDGCIECHSIRRPGEQYQKLTTAQEQQRLQTVRDEAVKQLADLSIWPTDVPSVWMRSARFDHFAHRTATCISCHAGAKTSNLHSDVMLPGIANCRQCHTEFFVEAGKRQGGVSWGCTECHRYHGGYVPPAGHPPAGSHPALGLSEPRHEPTYHAIAPTR